MKIAIAGTGYVGMSNGILLAQHNEVVALDIINEKVSLLNQKRFRIEDKEIEDFLANKPLNCPATLDKADAYTGADFVNIATPTEDDRETNYFITRSIEPSKPTIVADHLAKDAQRGLNFCSWTSAQHARRRPRRLANAAGPQRPDGACLQGQCQLHCHRLLAHARTQTPKKPHKHNDDQPTSQEPRRHPFPDDANLARERGPSIPASLTAHRASSRTARASTRWVHVLGDELSHSKTGGHSC